MSRNRRLPYGISISELDNITHEDVVDILLTSSGLPHPMWNPVIIYYDFLEREDIEESDRIQILEKLGILYLKNNERKLTSVLYLISNCPIGSWDRKRAKELSRKHFEMSPTEIVRYVTNCKIDVVKSKEQSSQITSPNFKEIHIDLNPIEVVILADFYGRVYKDHKRYMRMIDPYRLVTYHYDNILTGYIKRWIYDPEKVIERIGMVPNLGIGRIEYSWATFYHYRAVLEGKMETDMELVKILEKSDPHITFKTRAELVSKVYR